MRMTRRDFLPFLGFATASSVVSPILISNSISPLEYELTPKIIWLLNRWDGKSVASSPNTVGGPMWGGIRARASSYYKLKFFQENGKVPIGKHLVKCTYGRDSSCDVYVEYVSGVSRMSEVFIYPEEDYLSKLIAELATKKV